MASGARSLSGWVLGYLAREGSQPRAISVLALVSVGDIFLPSLPTQISVTTLGCLQPARAIRIAAAFALASAVGVAILALLVLQFGGKVRA
jgi:hypothetical protein